MQEEAVPMSEEETSDSEIVMVDPTQPCTKRTHEQRLADRHLRSQVGLIDTQLKALGLYEDGLSIEQKEELLAVVAASRETAQQEESMRLRAKEWQQKVFPDNVHFEVETTSPVKKSSPPSLVDACTSTKVETSLQLLNIDQYPESNPSSQELFEISESETVVTKSSPGLPPQTPQQNPEQSIRVIGSQSDKNRRYMGRRGRGRRPCLEYQTIQVTMPTPQRISQSFETVELNVDDVIEVDFRQQKKELEKSIPEWQPCASPEAPPMDSDRFLPEDEKATDENYSEKLLHSIEQFHMEIDNFQRNSGSYIPWGQPVTVGRAYATRSTRNRGPDSENSDGVYSFHSPNINDDLASSESSSCESYLRLRQFGKSLQQNSGTPNGANTTKTGRNSSQMVNKTSPRNLQRVNMNALLKRTRLMGRKTRLQNMNLDCLNSDIHKRNVSDNKSTVVESNPNCNETLMTTNQKGLNVESSQKVNEINRHNSNVPVSENKSANLVNATDVKNFPSRLFNNKQKNCITKTAKNTEIIGRTECY